MQEWKGLAWTFIKKMFSSLLYSCEFYDIFGNNFFIEKFLTTASEVQGRYGTQVS